MVVAAVVVVALGVIGGSAYLYLREWRPDLGDGERYGVDVSNHQGVVDWRAVAEDGISFAYVKASEGEDWVDSRFADNWAGAAAAGVPRGAYHFLSLCSDGRAQARHFLATAPPDPAALPPALDLELGGNCAARPDVEAVRREVDAFLAEVEAAWRRPVVLYVGDDWDERYPVTQDRPRWTRHLLRRPDGDWHIWQLHNFAGVSGIDGHVDLNVLRP
ncbi:lysozyme [Saccharothrix variisporea]|uniref:Lysozyme n=1 Tax=Saccharothrix variisporea TaxID=543527 RepID=A0A495XT96_9PSEU|nr:lysozyme [Saccharothrix variisporea]